jgi:hypothetical protein
MVESELEVALARREMSRANEIGNGIAMATDKSDGRTQVKMDLDLCEAR